MGYPLLIQVPRLKRPAVCGQEKQEDQRRGRGEKGKAGGLTSSYDPPLETYKKGWYELIFHEF